MRVRSNRTDEPDRGAVFLVYDEACPLCSRYVTLLRLRESFGRVELVSARDDHPAVRELTARGCDLDDGIALIEGDRIYFGDECMTRLALVTTPIGVFNRLNAAIFKSPRLSRLFYPILRFGRVLLLRILRRPRLTDRV